MTGSAAAGSDREMYTKGEGGAACGNLIIVVTPA